MRELIVEVTKRPDEHFFFHFKKAIFFAQPPPIIKFLCLLLNKAYFSGLNPGVSALSSVNIVWLRQILRRTAFGDVN